MKRSTGKTMFFLKKSDFLKFGKMGQKWHRNVFFFGFFEDCEKFAYLFLDLV